MPSVQDHADGQVARAGQVIKAPHLTHPRPLSAYPAWVPTLPVEAHGPISAPAAPD